ncbi:DHHA1 domain-containing protein [uncultured Clostridium sp.]|uniref:alanyl-tRNA editing protein n=1 Tax=uncultured Clostridium sp. TaxID=59620 RepID=UPI00260C5335|nr:DHHA1 domain-containing protein [uncultured Clostridium sp.]
MKKLYYEDNYIKEFIAEVVSIEEKNGKYYIVLDETAFFPGGGGQPSDVGTIEDSKVEEVYEEEGIIYHIVDKNVIKKHRVKCKINWEHRFDYMQQHLAQHLLSGCFFKLFNKNTAGIHLGKEISTIDIVGKLTEEEIRKAEEWANINISKNLKVEFLYPDKKDLKKMGLRRDLPKTNEKIRVVKIEDLDINACCGVHPSNTIELQCIKLKRFEGHKGNTRIEYLAGNRAIKDYLNKDIFAKKVCSYLSCSEEEVIKGIEKLKEDIKNLNKENKNLLEENNNYRVKEIVEECHSIKDIKVFKKIYINEDVKKISKLIEKISSLEKTVSLVAVSNGERVNMIFASSKDNDIDMGALLKDSITLIDGRGGGSKFLAQGGGKDNNNIQNALDYAERKLKESI